LGELYVRWIGDDDVNLDSMREFDEFDSTQVQDFRAQLGDGADSQQLADEPLDHEPLDDETGEAPNE
jgi:hypothetical protein